MIISKKILRDISYFSDSYKQSIIMFLDKLEYDPLPSEHYDIKKLKGFKDVYRVRFGDYRLIYAIYKEEKIIRILKITLRKKAYK
ncbi:MAG: type II toxin-antitoxin system RelE/ParE family toxin [Candidatus Odinarchaeota archaeon]|nr:type II toxin-antitoxin system RelE/ParE family toxin [Candidatus Odinarchaeota archaeon]